MQQELIYGTESGRPLQPPLGNLQESAPKKNPSMENELKDFILKGVEISQTEKPLGKGAYGVVRLGMYRGTEVAVKIPNSSFTPTEEQLKAFICEAKLMRGLPKNPHLVLFYGVHLKEGVYSLVMERCKGGSLREVLDNDKQNNIHGEQMLRWAVQIGNGLEQLHQKIVHGDLKSFNILLDTNNTAKITDFGLSVTLKNESMKQSSGSAVLARGTLAWMAPELFDEKPSSRESDIYSFGMVLWEMFTHQIPFQKLNTPTMMNYIIQGNLKALEDTLKEKIAEQKYPGVIQDLIKGCWKKEPTERPQLEVVCNSLQSIWNTARGIPSVPSVLAVTEEAVTEAKDKRAAHASLEALNQIRPIEKSSLEVEDKEPALASLDQLKGLMVNENPPKASSVTRPLLSERGASLQDLSPPPQATVPVLQAGPQIPQVQDLSPLVTVPSVQVSSRRVTVPPVPQAPQTLRPSQSTPPPTVRANPPAPLPQTQPGSGLLLGIPPLLQQAQRAEFAQTPLGRGLFGMGGFGMGGSRRLTTPTDRRPQTPGQNLPAALFGRGRGMAPGQSPEMAWSKVLGFTPPRS